MSTPVSVKQVNKLLELLGDPSGEKFQYLLANGDLLKPMIDADLTKVDRSAFGVVLTPAFAPVAWTPVDEYAERIMARSKLRGWGLTKTQIDAFAASLVDHVDPLQPTGISLWLGRDLQYNWDEAMAWMEDEVTARNDKFRTYFASRQVSFYPGSEQSGKRKLTVALLDVATYWNPTNGVVPDEVRTKEAKLPGLEVAWLLALSPQVYQAIDYKTIPGFIATGLVVVSARVPHFGHDSDEVFVYDYWADNRWNDYTVVAFRYCST